MGISAFCFSIISLALSRSIRSWAIFVIPYVGWKIMWLVAKQTFLVRSSIASQWSIIWCKLTRNTQVRLWTFKWSHALTPLRCLMSKIPTIPTFSFFVNAFSSKLTPSSLTALTLSKEASRSWRVKVTEEYRCDLISIPKIHASHQQTTYVLFRKKIAHPSGLSPFLFLKTPL